MGLVDQRLEVFRPAVGGVRCKKQDAVITPVAATGKIRDWHQFDCGESGVSDVIELPDRGLKSACSGECSDVQLEHGGVLPWPTAPVRRAPLVDVVVDPLAWSEYVLGLEMRCRIRNLEFSVDTKAVARAGMSVRRGDLMPPARHQLHRVWPLQQEFDAARSGSPQPESHARRAWYGPKLPTAVHGNPAKARTEFPGDWS